MADWQRFDGLFDAYWLKRGIKGLLRVSGVPPKAKGARRLSEAGAPGGAFGAPDSVSRAGEEGIGNPADRRGRREGASSTESLAPPEFRQNGRTSVRERRWP